MQVILREDVPTLGMIGEVVRVKPGYARNFLFPRGLAVPADKRNLKELEHHKRLIEIKKQRERGTYERLAQSIGALSLEIEQRAGRGGRLFGSVTNIDIHRLLEEKGVEIDRRRIELKDPIKEIGEFQITIKGRTSPPRFRCRSSRLAGNSRPRTSMAHRSSRTSHLPLSRPTRPQTTVTTVTPRLPMRQPRASRPPRTRRAPKTTVRTPAARPAKTKAKKVAADPRIVVWRLGGRFGCAAQPAAAGGGIASTRSR